MIVVYPKVYLRVLLEESFKHNILLFWLMFIGAAGIIVNSFRREAKNKALLIPLVFFLYPVFVGMISPSQGVLEWIFRYFGNLTPLYVIMGTAGLHMTFRWLKVTLAELWVGEETAVRIWRIVLAGMITVLFISLSIEEYENSKFYARGVENINSMQVRIGRWVRENSSPDAVLAVNDIGAIAYFSERKILDLVGLVTPEVLPYRKKQDGIFQFVALNKPDYVIIFPNWFPELPPHKEFKPIFDVSLEVNAVCGGPQMVVYETEWARDRRGGRGAAER
ncbi:MAG: hypothetical protein HY801_01020 [Candidatus Lindowbacteria bacterium]|nr:hypothetical protein [Candidatus Lindowbacteria bacterium]